MIIRKGKLREEDHEQLGEPNPKYDTRDIPLVMHDDLKESFINVSDCYMGIQHRRGFLRVDHIKISRFVNDGFAFYRGRMKVDYLEINNTLPFFYSRSNHNDCIHGQTHHHKDDVTIDRVRLKVRGKGARDKGNFLLTETSINNGFNLFEAGYDIDSYSKKPAIDFNNLRNSTLGSPENPLDGKRIGDRPVRIWGRKPGSPVSFNVVIHCYEDVVVQIPKTSKNNMVVRTYKRRWNIQDRRDNWELYKEGQRLLKR